MPQADRPLHRLVIRKRRLDLPSYLEDLGSGVTLALRPIPAGRFRMGSPEDELENYEDEQPQHEVRLEKFFLGKYPVTQAQWRTVAGYPQIEAELDPDPANFKGDNRPVEQVNWDAAREFCQRLSARTRKDYRLPSEAQWEYACRAGTTTPFHFGETLSDVLANYRAQDWEYEGKTYPGVYGRGAYGKFREETTTVGDFPGNRWGLHDMHGNVWEWCADDWHESYDGAPTDGSAWLYENSTEIAEESSTENKVLRGGSWVGNPRVCRSAVRDDFSRAYRYFNLGFRVCCVPPRILR
ncbi:MAG: formylglycine-generating enzyme family protein [Geitlerinemataceae cyanobacterium]